MEVEDATSRECSEVGVEFQGEWSELTEGGVGPEEVGLWCRQRRMEVRGSGEGLGIPEAVSEVRIAWI